VVQSRAMADEQSVQTLRAAVETIVPSAAGSSGAVDRGVHRFVAQQADRFLPGLAELLAALLDAYAAGIRPGAPFAELTPEERGAVLREMSREDSPDIREAVAVLLVFTLGGTYSEWTGVDKSTGEVRPPDTWRAMGYPGPALGHPSYRAGQ
jgi:Gluconate 2-dehydrogenase subunit 3